MLIGNPFETEFFTQHSFILKTQKKLKKGTKFKKLTESLVLE